MEKNKIKIVCNPYNKRIQYYWFEENEQWKDLCDSEDSALNVDKYTKNVSLPRIAFDLLNILVGNYCNKTVGLEIFFEGTEDDYNDLEVVRKNHFSQYDIELVKGTKTIKLAKEVMPQIEKIFSDVENYFKDYPDENTETLIAKYRETVRPEIALCIMGLYSSGKSAFINSLLGKELLPSDSDPATAKVYKIEESKRAEISFEFLGEEYLIEYSGSEWKTSKGLDNEILTLIKEKLDKEEELSEDKLMYLTLLELNKYAKKEGDRQHKELVKVAKDLSLLGGTKKNESEDKYIEELLKKRRIKDLEKEGKITANNLGEVIKVRTTFKHSFLPLDKFQFVIYDTPGSNSVQFREHAEVLKNSLEQQTNGLPIFVTTPDSMDEKDNTELIAIINELGGALDVSNMMLVINKSDDKAKATLEKKVENQDSLVLTKWKANRAYFVSSIVGLGGKKENKNEWIDADYEDVYSGRERKFGDPSEKNYLRLFEYNILPADAKERIKKRTEEIKNSELLLWNSGIPCVEEEIGIFAQKYALYNKCFEAIKYLSEAVTSVCDDIERATKNAEKLRRDIEAKFDEEKKTLIHQLESKRDSEKKEFTENFAENVTSAVTKRYLNEERIKGIINSVYSSVAGKNDHEKLNGYNDEIERRLSNDIAAYSRETSTNIQKYWNSCAESLRDELMKIVVNSPNLTNEQKEVLKEVVSKIVNVSDKHTQLNIKNTEAVYWDFRLFGFLWYMTTIDKKESIKKYKESLNHDIANNNKKAVEDNEKEFKNWTDRLLNELNAVIASFNPSLIELKENLDHQNQIVKTKNSQKEYIENAICQMTKLLSFEEV